MYVLTSRRHGSLTTVNRKLFLVSPLPGSCCCWSSLSNSPAKFCLTPASFSESTNLWNNKQTKIEQKIQVVTITPESVMGRVGPTL